VLFSEARVLFSDTRRKINFTEDACYVVTIEDTPSPVDWRAGEPIALAADDLLRSPAPDAAFGGLAAAAASASSYRAWKSQFETWLYSERPLLLYRSPSLKEDSRPGESERDFRIRLEQLAREQRDLLAENLRKKYTTKIERLQEKVRRAEQKLAKEKEQAGSQTLQSALSIGASLVGALFGRKLASATNVRRIESAARSTGRIGKERSDVGRAEEDLESTRRQFEEMEEEFQAELEGSEESIHPLTETLEEIQIRPKKSDIDVRLLALCWLPYWILPDGSRRAAWKA
jgi:hypothetical protein